MYHLKNAKFLDSWLHLEREYDPYPPRYAMDRIEPSLLMGEGTQRSMQTAQELLTE